MFCTHRQRAAARKNKAQGTRHSAGSRRGRRWVASSAHRTACGARLQTLAALAARDGMVRGRHDGRATWLLGNGKRPWSNRLVGGDQAAHRIRVEVRNTSPPRPFVLAVRLTVRARALCRSERLGLSPSHASRPECAYMPQLAPAARPATTTNLAPPRLPQRHGDIATRRHLDTATPQHGDTATLGHGARPPPWPATGRSRGSTT